MYLQGLYFNTVNNQELSPHKVTKVLYICDNDTQYPLTDRFICKPGLKPNRRLIDKLVKEPVEFAAIVIYNLIYKFA